MYACIFAPSFPGLVGAWLLNNLISRRLFEFFFNPLSLIWCLICLYTFNTRHNSLIWSSFKIVLSHWYNKSPTSSINYTCKLKNDLHKGIVYQCFLWVLNCLHVFTFVANWKTFLKLSPSYRYDQLSWYFVSDTINWFVQSYSYYCRGEQFCP